MPKQNLPEMFEPIPLGDLLMVASWTFAKMALAAVDVKGGEQLAAQNLRLAKSAERYRAALNAPPRWGDGQRWIEFVRDHWPIQPFIDVLKTTPIESAEYLFEVKALLELFESDAFIQAARRDAYYKRKHVRPMPKAARRKK